jgi:hypothetical protein
MTPEKSFSKPAEPGTNWNIIHIYEHQTRNKDKTVLHKKMAPNL